VLAEQGNKAALELAQQDALVAAHDAAQLGGARSGPPALEHRLDVLGLDAEPHPGLMNDGRQHLRRGVGGHVDDRARHGGDGDAAIAGGIAAVCPAGPVPDDAVRLSLSWGRHLGWRRVTLDQAIEIGRRASTKQRPLTAGEDSS
jgi:hypothetical protein